MEGVSFKNVKQVHITDPWWNEARIEQILARLFVFVVIQIYIRRTVY